MTIPAKKAILSNVSEVLLRRQPGFTLTTTTCSSSVGFSTAYEQTQGSPANTKFGDATATRSSYVPNDTNSEDHLHEGKIEGCNSNRKIENMSGITGFAADTARKGTLEAIKAAENIGELANETMENAWDAAKNTSQTVQDTLVAAADENVIDTTEYRNLDDLNNTPQNNDNDY